MGSAPFILFSGVRVGVGVYSGWTPLGDAVRVSDATGNVVRRIGDRPAVEFFKQHFGEDSTLTPEHPLGVFPQDGEGGFYLRGAVATVRGRRDHIRGRRP